MVKCHGQTRMYGARSDPSVNPELAWLGACEWFVSGCQPYEGELFSTDGAPMICQRFQELADQANEQRRRDFHRRGGMSAVLLLGIGR